MKDRFAEALAADERDDYEESYRLWKELAGEDSQVVSVAKYGRAAFKMEKWQEAQDAYERALEFEPDSSLVMGSLGHLWATRRDKDESHSFKTAEYWLLKSLKVERSAPSLTMLGAVYVALQDLPHAIDCFEDALRVDENYEEALYNLAVLKAEDMPLEAVKMLERAIEIDPQYGLAHQEIGKLYHGQGDVVRAEYHFRRSVDGNPADYWSYLYLANVLAMQDKDEEAERLYDFATGLHPEIEGGLKVFADFLDSTGAHQKAKLARKRAQNARDEGES